MIKYTRSLQKLDACLKDIFEAPNISIDTKAIALVLAATMSINKFNHFIDAIDKLALIAAKLKEVNSLRFKCGSLFRDFIILQTLHSLPHEVSSDELQQFIRDGKDHNLDKVLSQALSTDLLQGPFTSDTLSATTRRAAEYLVQKFSVDALNKLNTITEAYLQCRNTEKPLTAYYAVIHAMAEILELSGLDPKNSLLYSNKLAEHALKPFIHEAESNSTILHAYKTIDD